MIHALLLAATLTRTVIASAPSFYDLTTHAAAPLKTDAQFSYDAKNLYVTFTADQHDTPIVAQQTSDNVGFGLDDFVGVGIDTSGNASLVYFFYVTPHGIRYQQSSENVLYRPSWNASAQVRNGNWTATMVIPRSALHAPHGQSVAQWRINFVRNVSALNEHYTWAYDPLMLDGAIGTKWPAYGDAIYWPAVHAPAAALTAAAAPRRTRLELYGLESGGRDRTMFQQSDGAFAHTPVRMTGVDLSYAITPTIHFAGTLNPDFSNVDADQQTITPQEFRRSLVEYRPFFAEGASFFDPEDAPVGYFLGFRNQLFYSPAIGRFDRGFKVEGTHGEGSFGVMSFRGYDQTGQDTFDDQVYAYKFADTQKRFEYWADGVFTNHGQAGSDRTVEGGFYHRNVNSGALITADYAQEFVPGRRAQYSFNEMSGVMKSNYWALASYEDISPQYAPLDGYTLEGDLHGPNVYVKFFGSNSSVRNWRIGLFADKLLDGSGNVHELDNYLGLYATFKNGWSIDDVGPSVGLLRSYATAMPANGCSDPNLPRSYYTGYPSYICGRTDRYDVLGGGFGYKEGTPNPLTFYLTEGPYGPNFFHLYEVSHTRTFGHVTVSFDYNGVVQRSFATGVLDSQWLRRLSIGTSIWRNTTLSASLRAINGRGGFANPGVNLSAALDSRFPDGDELYLNFGSPSADVTLNRTILKFVHRFGSQPGT